VLLSGTKKGQMAIKVFENDPNFNVSIGCDLLDLMQFFCLPFRDVFRAFGSLNSCPGAPAFLAQGACQLLAMNVNRRFLRTRRVGFFAVVFSAVSLF